MSPATRPPPDFYRIAMGKGELRRWLKGFSFGHNPGVPEFAHDPKAAAQAKVFMFETEANEALAKARMHMPTAGLHVVPVRVTVRKVPRQHDFAWALRRMREGKRVRRAGWRSDSLHYTILDGYIVALPRSAVATPGERDIMAQDWELAP